MKNEFIKAWETLTNKSIGISAEVKLRKDQEKPWIELVQTLLTENNFKEADRIIEYQLINNQTPDAIFYKAISAYKQDAYTTALSSLEKINIQEIEALREEAFMEDVMNLKGKIFLKTKKYELANSVFRSLVDNSPDSLDYRFKLASTLALLHQEKEALTILEQLNTETPGILAVVKKIGYAYDQIKDFRKARSY